jgi:rhamnogalacturonan endolyase
VDGVIDEFRRDGVEIRADQALDLGALDWQAIRHGRQLWQIGTPDRSAKEFRHGDDYRHWGLWRNYPEEFPNDVTFVIGKSRERTDWNYAQVTVERAGQWVGTRWNIDFDLQEPPRPGAATLRIAIAAAQNAVLRVFVNDKQAGQSGRLGNDNAMVRAGIHGQYAVWDVPFDASLLRAGTNRITLDQREGGSLQKNIMYDCLRLEAP